MAVPIVRCAAKRFESVVAPGIVLVVVPSVEALAFDARDELGGVSVIARMAARCERKKKDGGSKKAEESQ